MSPDGISPAPTMPTASHSSRLHRYLKIISFIILAICIFAISLACFAVFFFPVLRELCPLIGRTATELCTMFCHFCRTATTTTSAATSPYSVHLNREVLASLPTFQYSTTGEDRPFDCSVCLTEFKDRERGWFLPRCLHKFHVECIDMWFLSHSTCPLCRSVVGVEIPEPPV